MKPLICAMLALCGCVELTPERVNAEIAALGADTPVKVYVYKPTTRGLYVPPQGATIILLEDRAATLRHELWHHWQWEHGQPFNEAEAERYAVQGVRP